MCLPRSLKNLSNMPIVFNILELNHSCVIVNWYKYVIMHVLKKAENRPWAPMIVFKTLNYIRIV